MSHSLLRLARMGEPGDTLIAHLSHVEIPEPFIANGKHGQSVQRRGSITAHSDCPLVGHLNSDDRYALESEGGERFEFQLSPIGVPIGTSPDGRYVVMIHSVRKGA